LALRVAQQDFRQQDANVVARRRCISRDGEVGVHFAGEPTVAEMKSQTGEKQFQLEADSGVIGRRCGLRAERIGDLLDGHEAGTGARYGIDNRLDRPGSGAGNQKAKLQGDVVKIKNRATWVAVLRHWWISWRRRKKNRSCIENAVRIAGGLEIGKGEHRKILIDVVWKLEAS